VKGADRTCLLVSTPGKPVPPVFDAGVQRIFTSTLAALSKPDSAVQVEAHGLVPPRSGLAAATCFTVAGAGVDEGEYCLTKAGLIRSATFPTGTLDLVAVGAAPRAADFTPPVRPTSVPG
jgi:hypothetical protein